MKAPGPMSQLPIDHFGLVTHALDELMRFFLNATPYRRQGEIIYDVFHDARITFLSLPIDGVPRLELIEPQSPTSRVFNAARHGGGLHHICFQVASLVAFSSWCRAVRVTLILAPTEAPAFGSGRRIAFVSIPGLGLVEFVETYEAPSLMDVDASVFRQMKKSFVTLLRCHTGSESSACG
jgi:methylmalonyl-CoA/ethylmalonyl-CoA epimerase